MVGQPQEVSLARLRHGRTAFFNSGIGGRLSIGSRPRHAEAREQLLRESRPAYGSLSRENFLYALDYLDLARLVEALALAVFLDLERLV